MSVERPLAIERMATWRILVSNWPLLTSATFIIVITLAAFGAPWLAPYDPAQMDAQARLMPPSLAHLLGTDQFGRDVLSRIMHGGRTSLEVALIAVSTAVVVGAALGILTALSASWVDAVLGRCLDVLIAFPALLLALFLVAVLGPDLHNLILAISLTRIPYFARLTRAEAAGLAVRPFVTAARTMGARTPRIVWRHILPNLLPLLIIFGTTDIATAIIAESALSYLGLGAQPPIPSWGRMLTESRGFINQAPWLAIFPGLTIMLTVIAFNLLGDALRDLLDPRLRSGR